MLTIEQARTRVARGAAHLDRVRPNWFTEIDEGTLEMSNCCRCIIGQLTGNFYRGLAMLDFPDDVTTTEYGVAVRPPAAPGTLDRVWRPLQDAWIEAIADRRLAGRARRPGTIAAPAVDVESRPVTTQETTR